jgi:TPR repeat protein
MHITTRFIALLLISLLALTAPIHAQSWRYSETLSGNRVHAVTFQETASIYYNPLNQTWYINLGLDGVTRIGVPKLQFTNSDGSGRTYSLKKELIKFDPRLGQEFSTVNFPVGQDILELVQSASKLTFINDKSRYAIPLTGSRAALSRAIGFVNFDIAAEDDRQHTAAQAKSDAAQALQRCDASTAHAWDANRTAAPTAWKDIPNDRAVQACATARELNGNIPRIVYQLGRAYDKTENPAALKLMRLAAWELEYPAAFYHLGTLHQDGLYTAKDAQKARRAFLEGASYEHYPSMYALGKMDYKSAKTDGEQKAALDLLFKSANKLYPYALDYVGTILFNGEIVGGSASSAVTYLQEASKRDQSNSSYLLHTMYRDGNGVDADSAKAQAYLKTAAKQGHAQAKKDLASQ